MEAWMRVLKVTLIAELGKRKQKQIVFGESAYEDQLSISVTGTKFLSPMKDEFVVHIKNIPQENAEVSVDELTSNEFRYLTIEAGYQNYSEQIFNGYIVSLTSKREDKNKTLDVVIVCSGSYTYNNLHGKTYTIKKGTSYYNAIMFAAMMSGIVQSEMKLTNTLKYKYLQNDIVFDGTLTSILIQLQQVDKTLLCHCDYTSQTKFSIWNANAFVPRLMTLTSENVILSNGFPSLEDQGVVFTVLPFFNFIPGDEIIFNDTSFINLALESLNAYTSTPYPQKFVSAEGHYIIRELRYNLENRGNDFNINLKCYSKEIYEQIKGSLT